MVGIVAWAALFALYISNVFSGVASANLGGLKVWMALFRATLFRETYFNMFVLGVAGIKYYTSVLGTA